MMEKLDDLKLDGKTALVTGANTGIGLVTATDLARRGHFLLTNLLLELLKKSSPSRIVIVSSEGHKVGKLDFNDLQSARGFRAVVAYGRSKTANILFGVELTKRLAGTGVTAFSLHPGVIRTEIFREFEGDCCMRCCCAFVICISCTKRVPPERGADTSLYCCLEPSIAGHSGKYYKDLRESRARPHATSNENAARLWEMSATLCQLSTPGHVDDQTSAN